MDKIDLIIENLDTWNGVVSLAFLVITVASVWLAIYLWRNPWRSVRPGISLLFLMVMLPILTVGYLKSLDTVSAEDISSRTREAKLSLIDIANYQIVNLGRKGAFIGYPDGAGVFTAMGWHPPAGSRYAYYCGDSKIVPTRGEENFQYPDPAADWPYGVYPEVSMSDFMCMAVGNIDKDEFPDVWLINKYRIPTHVIDDVRDKVLVDIIHDPFDPDVFFRDKMETSKGLVVAKTYIEINIPAYRLDLHHDGKYLCSYKIAVGMRAYKTPQRNFFVERIEWNPWWIPPRASWCSKKDEDGKEIGCKPVGPGRHNPLGPVKMIMQSSFLMHGTNKPSSIGGAKSHGCIRIKSENAMELAHKIMTLAGTKQPMHSVDTYHDGSRNTYQVSLLGAVQVAAVYNRIEVVGGKLLIHPDVYRYDNLTPTEIQKKLTAMGITKENIGAKNYARALRGTAEGTLEFPIRYVNKVTASAVPESQPADQPVAGGGL